MAHYDETCDVCGYEIGHGEPHARWCQFSNWPAFDATNAVTELLRPYSNVLTVDADRRLRRELVSLLSEAQQWDRCTAPWSNEQRPWFNNVGLRITATNSKETT